MDITRYEPADILIYIKDRGVVLTEKSLVAVHTDTKKIVAIGNDAEAIAEKNLPGVQVFSPPAPGYGCRLYGRRQPFYCSAPQRMGQKTTAQTPCGHMCSK